MREDHSEEEEMKYELEKETFQTESTLFCKTGSGNNEEDDCDFESFVQGGVLGLLQFHGGFAYMSTTSLT